MSDSPRTALAKRTTGQFENAEYRKERKGMITATQMLRFVRLAKQFMRAVESLSIDPDKEQVVVDTEAMRYGRKMEPVARQAFLDRHPGWRVEGTGLWRERRYYYIGASPDGLTYDQPDSDPHRWHATLELKCPYRYRDTCRTFFDRYNLLDFVEWNRDSGAVQMKREHEYFYQVQEQMSATGVDHSYFVVFAPTGFYHEFLVRAEVEWQRQNLELISELYEHAIVPYAKYKGIPLRQPGMRDYKNGARDTCRVFE